MLGTSLRSVLRLTLVLLGLATVGHRAIVSPFPGGGGEPRDMQILLICARRRLTLLQDAFRQVSTGELAKPADEPAVSSTDGAFTRV